MDNWKIVNVLKPLIDVIRATIRPAVFGYSKHIWIFEQRAPPSSDVPDVLLNQPNVFGLRRSVVSKPQLFAKSVGFLLCRSFFANRILSKVGKLPC